MTDSCCKLKYISLFNSLEYNENNIVFKIPIAQLVPTFDPQYSGIWKPFFYNQSVSNNNEFWFSSNSDLNRDSGVYNPVSSGCYKNYLGIQDFISINNIQSKNWIISNGTYTIDLVPHLNIPCNTPIEEITESKSILFWYRYYDIEKQNDQRIAPGLELYISEGEYLSYKQSDTLHSSVSQNLQPDVDKLIIALSGIGISEPEEKAKILATGPQFDWITEILASGRVVNSDHPDATDPTVSVVINGIVSPPKEGRTEYGLDKEKLRQMSLKTYRNIGVDNYILNKKALINKLKQKYGGALTVDSNITTSLESKFFSDVGPNVSVKVSGAIQLKNNSSAYYTMQCSVGDISFKTEKLSTVSSYDLNYADPTIVGGNQFNPLEAYWSGWPGPSAQKRLKSVDIFKASLNDLSIAHQVADSNSGIFNPQIDNIYFHGLGGIHITKGSLGGTYFIPGFDNSNIEKSPSKIYLSFNTGPNNRYKVSDFILIDYLRTPSRPDCDAFLNHTSAICNCFRLKNLDPTSTNFNTSYLPYVPDISLYHLPSGQFYGGYTAEEANKKPQISGHPEPGTQLPKDRKIIKDMSLAINSKNFLNGNILPAKNISNNFLNCDYSANGYLPASYQLRIPTVGKVFLNYIGINARFNIEWNGVSKSSTSGVDIFASQNGSICLEKSGIDPNFITIDVQTSGSGSYSWGWNVDFQSHNYIKDQFINRIQITGHKGFFHPNSGWISGVNYSSNPKYYNHSPIIPYQFNNVNFNKYARINYSAKDMYDEEYLNGYNYMVNINNLNFKDRNLFDQSKYVGIKINNSDSYLVTPNYLKFNYTRMDSPILEQIKFDYSTWNISDIEGENEKYPFGDLIYEKINDTEIKVSTKFLGPDRAHKSFDVPILDSETIIIKTTGNIEKEYSITSINKSDSNLSISLGSALTQDIPEKGFFYKKNKSLVIYCSSETYNDDILSLGKWGDLTVYNRIGDYNTSSNKHYNLSKLKSSTSLNDIGIISTNLTWSCPIKISNLFNNTTANFYINPRSRIVYNSANHSPSGFYTETFSSARSPVARTSGNNPFGSGSHIVSYTVPPVSGQTSLPIYLGSDIGNYNIAINITKWNKNGQIKLYYNNGVVDTDIINGSGTKPTTTGIVDNNKKQILLSFNKTSSLPIFGEIIIENNVQNCYSNKQPSFIENVIVYIDESSSKLTTDSRVSYYQHDLSTLPDTEDRLSYLDMHLFGNKIKTQLQNIRESGSVYFENALSIKNNKYYDNMPIKYNNNQYWFDLNAKIHYGILSSKNILLLPHITYTFTKSLEYNCDENARNCSSRYSNDVCSSTYDATLEDVFNILGLNNVPLDLFDINIKRYPIDCNQIDECCLTSGCVSAQTGLIKQCNDKYKKTITCKNLACPPSGSSIGGNYNFTQEIYEFKIKETLSSSYFPDTADIVFFDNISGYSGITFENYNTNSYIINLDNQNILRTENNKDSNYLFGPKQTMDFVNKTCSIDPSGASQLLKYIYNQQDNIPLGTGHHLYNELIYRSYVPHPNVINGPLFEYDPIAEHDDVETIYNINFGSKECISNNQNIMSMVINNNISLNANLVFPSGYILIECNGESKTIDVPVGLDTLKVITQSWPVGSSGCGTRNFFSGPIVEYFHLGNDYRAIGEGGYASTIANAINLDTKYLPESGLINCEDLELAINTIANNNNFPALSVLSCSATNIGEIISVQNCVLPCQATISIVDDNPDLLPPTQEQLDNYNSACPDATEFKEINASYYWVGDILPNPPWDIKKYTQKIKTKNNYSLVYGKNNLQQITGTRQKVVANFKTDDCLNTVNRDDIRNCCKGYDLSNMLSVAIQKYKNIYIINVHTNINNDLPGAFSDGGARFCIPITEDQHFECPQIQVSLGPNIFLTDSVSSSVYNCSRGIIS